MEFTELSEEELGAMQFASGRERKGKSPYDDPLKAVKEGKKVLVKLEPGKQIRHLKWGLSQAAKRSGIKLDMKVPADQSGVVVSVHVEAPVPHTEAGQTDPQVPACGKPIPQIISEAGSTTCHRLPS